MECGLGYLIWEGRRVYQWLKLMTYLRNYLQAIALSFTDLRWKGLLPQTSPLDFHIHQVKPGDWGLIKILEQCYLNSSMGRSLTGTFNNWNSYQECRKRVVSCLLKDQWNLLPKLGQWYKEVVGDGHGEDRARMSWHPSPVFPMAMQKLFCLRDFARVSHTFSLGCGTINPAAAWTQRKMMMVTGTFTVFWGVLGGVARVAIKSSNGSGVHWFDCKKGPYVRNSWCGVGGACCHC